MQNNIVVITEDKSVRQIFNKLDMNCCFFNNIPEFIENKTEFDIILLDLEIKDVDYKNFLESVRIHKNVPVILLTKINNLKLSDKLINFGYNDSVVVDGGEDFKVRILNSINDALKGFKLSETHIEDFFYLSRLMYGDRKIKETISLLKKVSNSEMPVLITGEAGIGKELFARAIHFNSKRKNNPFITVNCALLREENLEKILFGYYDLVQNKIFPGKFQLADKGTLYFDEIDGLDINIQSKILRAVQGKEIEPIGSSETLEVNCRIICSTNKKLEEEIENGNFRKDLYYAINSFELPIAPLRERKSDISLLARSFLQYFNEKEGKDISEITPKALSLLMNYDWPGNTRELKNSIFRAYSLCEGKVLDVKDFDFIKSLSKDVESENISVNIIDENGNIKNFKRLELEIIEKIIGFTSGNISEASNLMNIGRATFYRKLRELNLLNSDDK